MSTHPPLQIIGFLDTVHKWPGTFQSTYFEPGDCFTAAHIPAKADLIAHATKAGLFPSGKEGSSPEICNALYHVDGLDHLHCRECFPAWDVPAIDKVRDLTAYVPMKIEKRES